MLRVDRSAMGNADATARYALLQIVRVRFAAFEAKFGRLPKPDEPIFFDDSFSHPVKAGVRETRAQLEQGARETRVELYPVLRFLGLSYNVKSIRRPASDAYVRSGGRHAAQLRTSNRRESGVSSGWNRFLANESLHRRHRITREELQALSATAFLGEATTERDFLLILEMIRRRKAG